MELCTIPNGRHQRVKAPMSHLRESGLGRSRPLVWGNKSVKSGFGKFEGEVFLATLLLDENSVKQEFTTRTQIRKGYEKFIWDTSGGGCICDGTASGGSGSDISDIELGDHRFVRGVGH